MNKNSYIESALLDVVGGLAREVQPHRGRIPEVTLNSSLEKELAIDSLGRVELLLRLEQRFDVSLSEQILATATTPRDLLTAVLAAGRTKVAASVPHAAPATTPSEEKSAESPPTNAATLIELLDWHAETHPDKTHIYLYGEDNKEELITYGALRKDADKVATGLMERGVKPGESVAIMLPTGREYFSTFFGVLAAGAVPVPLYPPASPMQIEEHLLRHAEILKNAVAGTLITIPEARSLSRLLKAHVECLDRVVTVEDLSAKGVELRRGHVDPEDRALLQYTSGTTGNPKGVILTHRNLITNIRAMGDAVDAKASDVFVSWLPLYHDMGLIGAWLGSLYYGMELVLMSPLAFLAKPERWLWTLHRHRGTISGGPNFGYELCIRKIKKEKLEGLDLSSWRMAFNGAEPVSPDTIERFIEHFKEYGFDPKAFMPVYGLAESSVGLAFTPLSRGALIDRIKRDSILYSGRAEVADKDDSTVLSVVACGNPLPGHEIRIVDESGRELGERMEGMLQFKGPSTTAGYMRNAEETAKLFDGEWLNSGDRGYVAGGELYLTGRSKDVIIRAGRNIYPYELEEAIGNIAGIRTGCVVAFGSTDPLKGTERLVIIAETRKKDFRDLEKLRVEINTAATRLVAIPPEVVVLALPHSILKTSSGKIRRSAMRELYERGKIGWRRYPMWWQVTRLTWGALIPELRRLGRRTKELLYASYAWTVFLLLATTTWILTATVPGLKRRRRITKVMGKLIIKLTATPLLIQGIEELPKKGACIVVANHASYIDGIILAATLPPDFSFVAKRELTGNFIARVFLGRIGASFVERFDTERSLLDTEVISETIKKGASIGFFAEGTLDRAPGIRPFHMGSFVTAAKAGIPVVPVAIRGSRSIFRAYSWFPRRGALRVTLSSPIYPEGRDWSAAIKMRDATRETIIKHSGEPDVA